jgi:hypothetical protein
MSTVNDVIVSYGGDSKRYSRDFQTKEEFKRVGTPFCPGRMLR